MSNLKARIKSTTTASETIVDQIEYTLGMYCAVCIEKIGLIYLREEINLISLNIFILGEKIFDFFLFLTSTTI